MRTLFPLLVATSLVGCGPPPPDMTVIAPRATVQAPIAPGADRFTVTRVTTFYDSMAYNSQRSIYILRDTKTGAEYVGVSGIGISELGSHLSGKVTVTHEQ